MADNPMPPALGPQLPPVDAPGAAPEHPTYRPLRKLAAWLVAMLAVCTVTALVDVVMSLYALHLHEQVQRDVGAVGQGAVPRIEAQEIGMGAITVVAYLVTAVLFLVWFRRCYRNIAALDAGARRRYAPGWAVGAWFVPIINLVRPKRIADDIWLASPLITESGDMFEEPPAWTAVWWATWLIAVYLGRVSLRSWFNSETLDEIISAYWAAVAAAVVDVVLGVLAIWLVLTLTRRQQLHAARWVMVGRLPLRDGEAASV